MAPRTLQKTVAATMALLLEPTRLADGLELRSVLHEEQKTLLPRQS
jgi:hypothetical protein